jgi:DNA-binding NarL/FixJ family response regulator
MERLKERDLQAILAFLREAYGQPDLDAYARYTVEALPRVVGAQRVSYNEAHPRVGTIRAVIKPDDGHLRLNARQYRDHPMFQRFLATGDGRAYKFSDFLTRAELHATEMYQGHYRLIGVEHQMLICLGKPSPHSVGFALSRDRLDFSERDRIVLDLLRPHLVGGYDQAAAAARLHAGLALLARAAEAAEAGIVLFNTDGRIDYATRQARHWLREYFGRRGRPSSRLPDAIGTWLRRARPGDPPGRLEAPPGPLVVVRDGRRLAVRFVADDAQRALLLEEYREGPSAAALAPLGLTARESEVLALVARGAGNEAIASSLGARARTVAKHLERIHRKLGVESRAAAAARAHDVWAAAPPPALD